MLVLYNFAFFFDFFKHVGQNSVQRQQSSTSISGTERKTAALSQPASDGSGQIKSQANLKDASNVDAANNLNSTATSKLPPRPADYDYFYYQDEEGNWWNEYDDMGYEFDPNRYEGEEEPSAIEQVPNTTATETSTSVDNKKINKLPSEKNKDVDCSGGITELKVRIISKCVMI